MNASLPKEHIVKLPRAERGGEPEAADRSSSGGIAAAEKLHIPLGLSRPSSSELDVTDSQRLPMTFRTSVIMTKERHL